MCTFLIVNISSLQLIPVNIIAYRSQYGSVNPAAVVGPGLIATICSTAAAIIFCKLKNVAERKRKTIIVHRRNADRVSRYGACMGRRKYVLIVDDCQQDRMAVADVLRSDYDILEACNGKQALEILSRKRAQISLIMLDLMMPVMDGYEFLEMYRKRKEYSYLPVVVCTTEDDPEREQKSLELGAWDFVLKKSSPGIMRLRAGNAIEKSKVRFLEYDFLTGIYGQQKFYQATRELLDQRAERILLYPF